MTDRFHATVAVSDDQTGEPSITGPKRKTAKNAAIIAVYIAINAKIDEKVKIEIYEDDVLLLSAYGDTPKEALFEVKTMLDRNRRRY